MKRQSSCYLLAILFLGFATAASASDHGCRCLLCLSNPNGPRAIAECRPPIDRLFRDLSLGRPFPACELAEGPNGRSYAQQGSSFFDVCPSGMTALAVGAAAIQAIPDFEEVGIVRFGIGEGDDWLPSEDRMPPTKVCVGNAVGTAGVVSGGGEFPSQVVVTIYDRLTVLDPQGSPRVIDVYVDDLLYRRVRW